MLNKSTIFTYDMRKVYDSLKITAILVWVNNGFGLLYGF